MCSCLGPGPEFRFFQGRQKMIVKLHTLFLLISSLCVSSHAAFGLLPDGHLDMAAIRKAYMESDFVPVRETLEAFYKAHRRDATRDEKVFTHVYLGVIYAADSIQDAKAESHFNALMDIAPNIELVDMFVPPKIQNIFDRVKHDYLRMKEYGRKYDALGNPLPNASDSAEGKPLSKTPPEKKASMRPERQSHAWMWWTAGCIATVGAGVGLYILATSGSPSDNVTHATGP
jgi:hypothetical protein